MHVERHDRTVLAEVALHSQVATGAARDGANSTEEDQDTPGGSVVTMPLMS